MCLQPLSYSLRSHPQSVRDSLNGIYLRLACKLHAIDEKQSPNNMHGLAYQVEAKIQSIAEVMFRTVLAVTSRR